MEWIEMSRRMVMDGAAKLPGFDTPNAEFSELHIELTYACNLKCRMCNIWNIWRNDSMMPKKEMSVEELIDYIEESRVMDGLKGVVISGGEPFLKKDFSALCLHLLKRYPGISIGVLSNLYNHNLVISRLRELGNGVQRMWIGTSLDGLAGLHDNTRGVPGAFDRFINTLNLLRNEFPRLPVSINYTLTTDNYRGIYEAHRFCREQALDLSVQFPVPWEGAENFSFTPEQVDEIEQLLLLMMKDAVADFEEGKMDEQALMARIFYLSGLTDYERNQRRVFKRCVAGRRFTSISPDGKVYFCPCLKDTLIGDLRENPFDEIWNGKEAKELRRKIDACFCHCWLNCTIYPNASEALVKDRRTAAGPSGMLSGLLRKVRPARLS